MKTTNLRKTVVLLKLCYKHCSVLFIFTLTGIEACNFGQVKYEF